MKFSSVIPFLALSSFGLAKIVTVTDIHYTTVYNGQAIVQPSEAPDGVIHYTTIIYVDENGNILEDQEAASTQAPQAPSTSSANQGPALAKIADAQPTTLVTVQTSAAPAPAPTSSSSTSNSFGNVKDVQFSQQMLDLHNQKRADHKAGALTWSQELYNYAQNYADSQPCSLNLVHSGGPYGENLAVGYSGAAGAFDAWYNEGNNYNYVSNIYNHFTQIIWVGTTQLGCAYKQCNVPGINGQYVVCSYNPAGNIIGKFIQNVLPLFI
ncbi:CAP domain-containing protein [Scheffersomyces amazonensis]|uniref:CAP domain-containing protein n=1 Tax=Scheffersomyces amazonensis TaxID=1078765 RepID=UPI00315D8A62